MEAVSSCRSSRHICLRGSEAKYKLHLPCRSTAAVCSGAQSEERLYCYYTFIHISLDFLFSRVPLHFLSILWICFTGLSTPFAHQTWPLFVEFDLILFWTFSHSLSGLCALYFLNLGKIAPSRYRASRFFNFDLMFLFTFLFTMQQSICFRSISVHVAWNQFMLHTDGKCYKLKNMFFFICLLLLDRLIHVFKGLNTKQTILFQGVINRKHSWSFSDFFFFNHSEHFTFPHKFMKSLNYHTHNHAPKSMHIL